MNWTRFQTYGTPPDKAFEMLCNQLFDNWCNSEYGAQLVSFNIVNGAGGDGGVESYATLTNGDIVGIQAKWFLNSMDSSQISQIKVQSKLQSRYAPKLLDTLYVSLAIWLLKLHEKEKQKMRDGLILSLI